jgi:hypothetical protein
MAVGAAFLSILHLAVSDIADRHAAGLLAVKVTARRRHRSLRLAWCDEQADPVEDALQAELEGVPGSVRAAVRLTGGRADPGRDRVPLCCAPIYLRGCYSAASSQLC